MYHPLEKIIARYYGLQVQVVEKIDNVYILRSNENLYVLKETSIIDEAVLNIQSSYLVFVIPTRYHRYLFEYQQSYYYLMEYVMIGQNDALTLTHALSCLAHLHHDTFYTCQVPSTFYKFEYEQMKHCLTESYAFYDQLIDDLLINDIYHPGIWLLLELYPSIQNLKQFAFELLSEYHEMIKEKTSCRFCLSLNQIDFSYYSKTRNCFIHRDQCSFEMVGKDFLQIVKEEIEYDNIDNFYLKTFLFDEVEKYWIILHLLCLEKWDFYKDGLESVKNLYAIKQYMVKINKVLKSLQINKGFMYNEDR